MLTPYFPALRSRLAALGRRTAQTLRQTTLAQLQQHLRDLLPAPLLASEDEGPNSRERIYTLRLTFECFLWQLLKPKTSCREVVRQVQALFQLHEKGSVDEGDSAYHYSDIFDLRSFDGAIRLSGAIEWRWVGDKTMGDSWTHDHS